MNLAFFLTPVVEVVWLKERSTVRQALERMRRHRYTAVPLVDDDQCYVGTLTEGDLLWKIVDDGLTTADLERVRLAEVPRHADARAVGVQTDVRELLTVAADQNFVPVTDDRGVLMGIVTRRAILAHCAGLLADHGLLPAVEA